MARLDPRWLVQSADPSGFDQMTKSGSGAIRFPCGFQTGEAPDAPRQGSCRGDRRRSCLAAARTGQLPGRQVGGRGRPDTALRRQSGPRRGCGRLGFIRAHALELSSWKSIAGVDRLWFRPHIAALAGAIGLSVYGAACGQASRASPCLLRPCRLRRHCSRAAVEQRERRPSR